MWRPFNKSSWHVIVLIARAAHGAEFGASSNLASRRMSRLLLSRLTGTSTSVGGKNCEEIHRRTGCVLISFACIYMGKGRMSGGARFRRGSKLGRA